MIGRLLVAALTVGALAAAACGGSSPSSSSGSSSGSSTGSSSGAAQKVTFTETEFKIDTASTSRPSARSLSATYARGVGTPGLVPNV